MPDIATEAPLPDPILPLPEIPTLPDVSAEVALTSESLSFSSWPHATSDCPNSWSPTLTTPCSSHPCLVGDVSPPLGDDVSDHIAADRTLAEWPQAKRRRRKLAHAWNDIPALVNLIVAISIDEAANAPDPGAHQDIVTSPTNVSMVSAFAATPPVTLSSQKILPTTETRTNVPDSVSLPSDTNPIIPDKKEVIPFIPAAKDVSDDPID